MFYILFFVLSLRLTVHLGLTRHILSVQQCMWQWLPYIRQCSSVSFSLLIVTLPMLTRSDTNLSFPTPSPTISSFLFYACLKKNNKTLFPQYIPLCFPSFMGIFFLPEVPLFTIFSFYLYLLKFIQSLMLLLPQVLLFHLPCPVIGKISFSLKPPMYFGRFL